MLNVYILLRSIDDVYFVINLLMFYVVKLYVVKLNIYRYKDGRGKEYSGFRKSFRGCSTGQATSDYLFFMNVAGRMETTSAVNAIQFKMASGNIDSGTISLYGITK